MRSSNGGHRKTQRLIAKLKAGFIEKSLNKIRVSEKKLKSESEQSETNLESLQKPQPEIYDGHKGRIFTFPKDQFFDFHSSIFRCIFRPCLLGTFSNAFRNSEVKI